LTENITKVAVKLPERYQTETRANDQEVSFRFGIAIVSWQLRNMSSFVNRDGKSISFIKWLMQEAHLDQVFLEDSRKLHLLVNKRNTVALQAKS
jgi:hypothetical protein